MNRTISTSARRWLSGALIAAASAAVLLPGTAAAEQRHAPLGVQHNAPRAAQQHTRPQPGHGALWHGARPSGGHAAPPMRHAAPPMRHVAPPVRSVVRAPAHRWQPGHWVPVHARRPVHNWRAHRLPPPASGHQWVWLDGGFAHIALSTGLITLIINA